MSYAQHRERAHEMRSEKMARLKRSAGGSADEREDKAMIEKAIRQHEAHDHKGEKPTAIRLREGGAVDGKKAKPRADRKARGGATGKKGHTNIVIVAPQGQGQPQGGRPVPVPVPVPHPVPVPVGPGAGGPPPVMAGRPMPGPMGAPGGMPGGMPMKPPGMANRGGRQMHKARGGSVNKPMVEMDAGAGGGLGRIEKAKLAKKDRGGKKSGGRAG